MTRPETRGVEPDAVTWDAAGLVPAIVQDERDGRVLMLAWMDPEALMATLRTGEVHFHSRSRDRLWRKGETSGHVLRLRGLSLDCDADAILVTVDPVGPTCHRETRSCFDEPLAGDGAGGPATGAHDAESRAIATAPAGSGADGEFAWLDRLWATIDARAEADPAASYTARLLAKGVNGPARKVAEEAAEVVIAAKDDAAAPPERRAETSAALAGELADLLYHTLVLLRERELRPADVIARLQERHRP